MKKMVVFLLLALVMILAVGCTEKADDTAAEKSAAESVKTPEPTLKPTETPKPTSKITETPKPAPQEADESLRLEVSDYLLRCADVVDVLPKDTARESWQMSVPAWHCQGFWLEYQDDPERGRIFTMQNEEVNDVTLYGNRVDETYREYETDLFAAGWKFVGPLENMREYGIKLQDNCILLVLHIDDDGIVHSWYLHNWPQGDWYSDFFSQFDR